MSLCCLFMVFGTVACAVTSLYLANSTASRGWLWLLILVSLFCFLWPFISGAFIYAGYFIACVILFFLPPVKLQPPYPGQGDDAYSFPRERP